MSDPIIFDGPNPRGRFGTSLANLGDIDHDGNEGRGTLLLTCMHCIHVVLFLRGEREGDRKSHVYTCTHVNTK